MQLSDSVLATLPGEVAARIREMQLLVRSAQHLNESLELGKLLVSARDLVREAVACDLVNLLLLDAESQRLRFYLSCNQVRTEAEPLSLPLDAGLAGRVFHAGMVRRWSRGEQDLDPEPDLLGCPGAEAHSILAVPLRRGRHVTGVLEAIHTSRTAGFDPGAEGLLASLGGYIALALENALLYRLVQREKVETEGLYRIGLKLGQTLELKEILPLLLDLLHQAIPYDAAAIYLINPTGREVELFTARGYDPETERKVVLKLGQGAVGWVAKTGEPLLMVDVSRDARYFNARPATRSEVVVPIIVENQVIGAFNLESDRLAAFQAGDVKLLTTFAAQAAISIQRARLHEELIEKRRIEGELKIARAIQERMFPREAPESPGMQIAGLNLPGREVSGDLYDFVQVFPGHVGIMIADVSGKGVPAALVGSTFRASLRAEIRNNYALTTILSKVNDLLVESQDPEIFVTSVYGVLDCKARRLTYANAGHNPPLWLRADGGIEWLWEGGTILGAYPGLDFSEEAIRLAPGDLVVFYTDGVVEATSSTGEEFGSSRLVEVVREVREREPGAICRRIADAARLHEAGDQADDLTVVVLKVRAGSDEQGR